ncbi:MAG TPA: hypothetical protein VKQ71_08185 [Acidimicrobiales bacterium]|nr:hypothetical protein [Acidimicrobiales bacterium]
MNTQERLNSVLAGLSLSPEAVDAENTILAAGDGDLIVLYFKAEDELRRRGWDVGQLHTIGEGLRR